MRNSLIGLGLVTSLVACGSYPGGGTELQGSSALCAANEQTLSGFNWFRWRKESPGSVSVTTTDEDLVVDIDGVNGWLVADWHLYAGTGEVPVNKLGYEAPGRFPYQGDGGREGAVQVTVPLTDLNVGCNDDLTVSVHVVMVQLNDYGRVKAWMSSWADWQVDWAAKRWGGEFTHTVCCDEDPPPPPAADCVKAPWYYAQADEAWPTDSVDLGSTSYSKSQMLEVLALDWYQLGGDVSVYLAQHTIGARLNEAEGVALPADVVDALADADAFFDEQADDDGRVPYGVLKDTAEGDAMLPVMDTLYLFNIGQGGVPFCGQ